MAVAAKIRARRGVRNVAELFGAINPSSNGSRNACKLFLAISFALDVTAFWS